MEAIVRVALEQAFALLCAVIIVSYIAPSTRGGAILLGLVTFAFVTLVVQVVRYLWKIGTRNDTPDSKDGATS
jgi:hypothetical protein